MVSYTVLPLTEEISWKKKKTGLCFIVLQLEIIISSTIFLYFLFCILTKILESLKLN